VTGPTGSGKTTTLYAGLSEINETARNIMTIEDPVEYMLPGIGQTQVNPRWT
jgi:general secretion pathway protein E